MMANWLPRAVVPPELVVPSPEQESFRERHSRALHNARATASFTVRSALAVGIGMAAGVAFGDTTVQTDHLEAQIHTEPTFDLSGSTRLNTPVLDLDYPTHKGPYGLEITPEDISFNELVGSLAGDTNSKTPAKLSQTLRSESLKINQATQDHVLKYLLLTGSVTAASFYLLSAKESTSRARKLAGALLIGGLAVGAPAAMSYVTWDADAFSKATYTGDAAKYLSSPDLINNLDKYDADLSKQAKYVLKLVQSIESLNNRTEEDIAVRGIAIGDIHQRNVYPTLKVLIGNYDADFVIDAGDIVDWGQSFENGFFLGSPTTIFRENSVGIADLGVPYYFAAGNHDGKVITVKAVREAGAIILEVGEYSEQNGLVITGAKDPNFSPGNDPDPEAEIKSGKELQAELNRRPADIAVLHNPLAGEQVTNGVQLQISGHTHSFKYQSPVPFEQPARLNTGTAGGAGLRNYDNEEGTETEQTFTLINFGPNCRLVSLDKITITSLSGEPEFNIKHIPVEGSADTKLYEYRACI